jgi:diacylglycerol kinase family enzyme
VAGHERLFCVNAGFGLDAETVQLVEARPWLKTRLRHAGFAGATVAATAREARSPASIAVVCDGRAEGSASTVLVAVASPYAFLGPRPLDLVPGAAGADCPRWIALRSTNPLRVAQTVAGALSGGRHLRTGAVFAGEACDALELTASRPVAVQADGEPLGWHDSARVSPGPTLRVLVPAAG